MPQHVTKPHATTNRRSPLQTKRTAYEISHSLSKLPPLLQRVQGLQYANRKRYIACMLFKHFLCFGLDRTMIGDTTLAFVHDECSGLSPAVAAAMAPQASVGLAHGHRQAVFARLAVGGQWERRCCLWQRIRSAAFSYSTCCGVRCYRWRYTAPV